MRKNPSGGAKKYASFTCGGDFASIPSFDMYDIGDSLTAFADIPDSFHNIPPKQYPLVITFEKFLMMLDGSMGNSFFEKFNEFNAVFLDKSGMSRSVALQSVMRQKVVTYARFTSLYWPHFNTQLTRKLDPSTVFTEIISHIKGGLTTYEPLDSKISRDFYRKLSDGRASTLNCDERDAIYDIFLDYEKKKLMNGDFDLSDFVIDLHRRLKIDGGQIDHKIDFVYVDEVQDLSMRQIALFKYVCNNFDEGFVFAGDTAQTIARGIDFRFQDIRSLFYNEFHSVSTYDHPTSLKFSDKHISDMFHLSQNFRTHDGILKLAQSIVDILYCFFPYSIDRLCPETSPIFGEAPILLECGNDENAIMTIFGNRGIDTPTDCSNGFGAEQVILVRDDNSRREISDLVKKQALVLTIFECKGLEFQDVLLYNFFSDSPMRSQFRVIYDYMRIKNLLDSSTISFPSFEMMRHKLLCSELKQLYVAITRTRQRLWICESLDEYAKPIFDYWKKLCLIRVRRLDSAVTQDMCVSSTKEEWRVRGIKLFNEGNYEMATMCFERAGDIYREKWARASGLRVSAEYVRHSNFEMARILLTEAAEIYETIGKADSAASCYIELKEFKRAGTIYLEKCGETRLEDAGDCFSLAGCWSLAAEVYSKGGYFSKCLSVCSKGDMFELGLQSIECWKERVSSAGFNGNSKELDEMKDTFLEKCALHYHNLKDRRTMMKFVEAFSSLDCVRTFLKTRDYLAELVIIEEKLGNFLEAASIARMKQDLVLEANMLEKAGQAEEASRIILFHVVVNSLWASGNKGWPLKQFTEKELLLEKAKSFAAKSSGNFFETVCVETRVLADQENSLAELVEISVTAGKLGSTIAEVLSFRRALDLHLHSDPSKFLWKPEVFIDPENNMNEIVLHNQLSSETLMYMWNFWRDKILDVLENLRLFGTRSETKDLKYWVFCLEYLGFREVNDHKYAVFNSEASWIKENDMRYLLRDGKLALDDHQFASAANNFWTSELFSVGLEVLTCLKALDNFVVRSLLSPLCRGMVLLHIIELSKFLLHTKPHSKPMQSLASSKRNFLEIVFPINWRLVSSEAMIALRENDAANNLLKEILVERVNSNNGKLTYGKLGSAMMVLFATGNHDEVLYQAILNHSELMPHWTMLIEHLRMKSPKFHLAMNLSHALSSTFQINWRNEIDYISPQCFLYLSERLLFLILSCRCYFFTTKAYLIEALSCPELVAPSVIDADIMVTLTQSSVILGNMVSQFLFDKVGTQQWVKKFNVNQYYSLLVLRAVVIISLLHINTETYIQMIPDCLKRREITSELPHVFNNCLRNKGQGSFQDKFASALMAIDDPLLMVCSEIDNPMFRSSNVIDPIFESSDVLLINLNSTSRREDILGILFRKNLTPDQTGVIELACEKSCNINSSKDSESIACIHPSVLSSSDCGLEDFSLQKSCRHICKTIDDFALEFLKGHHSDRILSKSPQVKVRERRPKMEALVTMLKGFPITTALNTETPAVAATIETPAVAATIETPTTVATSADTPTLAATMETPTVAAASVPHHKGKKGKQKKGKKGNKGKNKKGK